MVTQRPFLSLLGLASVLVLIRSLAQMGYTPRGLWRAEGDGWASHAAAGHTTQADMLARVRRTLIQAKSQADGERMMVAASQAASSAPASTSAAAAAAKPASEADQCRAMQKQHGVVAHVSWGSLPPESQARWSEMGCDLVADGDAAAATPAEASAGVAASAATFANTGTAAAMPLPTQRSNDTRWLEPDRTHLLYNDHAKRQLAPYVPAATTLHFTFGSAVMMDFVKNWLHFAQKAQLAPLLVGAADGALNVFCEKEGYAAAAINPRLDVWTYKLKPKKADGEVFEMKTQWSYFRHHNSDFLEMGLVKVAFLYELLGAGFDVLISDLDVVWLNDGWRRWMTWRDPTQPPVAEAALIAFADVLVTSDELNTDRDAQGGRSSELNTGVVYFRAGGGGGAKAMVQAWRESMLRLSRNRAKSSLTENDNDQSLFNQIVHGSDATGDFLSSLERRLGAAHATLPYPRADVEQRKRKVYRSNGATKPCLPDEQCAPTPFTFATLPIRPFASGHTWFNQDVQNMPGHELPQHRPVNVHFTFQFGDTPKYPHGKRQRAREAALWAVDPPEYFSAGVYVALKGPTYTADEMASVYRRFPEWSPQRHMHMDAPQRAAVRDLLALASTLDGASGSPGGAKGVTVLPKFQCHCDRYWNFLSKCRIPFVPNMRLPFSCPMDSLYLADRWNDKGVQYREHTFLSNPNVPAQLRDNRVTLAVAAYGEAPGPSTPSRVEVAYGTPISDVPRAVFAANPRARVIEVEAPHLRRLCKWLGTGARQRAFNKLTRYILTESSRYCPNEDHGGYGAPGFNWQNPFTAYNCTWGFRAPAEYPETDAPPCAVGSGGGAGGTGLGGGGGGGSGAGIALEERSNSSTCPRQMLCDHNVAPDGRVTAQITRCNIEGYNGFDPRFRGLANAMLAKMPDGRCPYPPGDRPGMSGFDSRGHYVGGNQTGTESRGGRWW